MITIKNTQFKSDISLADIMNVLPSYQHFQ